MSLGIVCPYCGEKSNRVIATANEIWNYPVEYEIDNKGRRKNKTIWSDGERVGKADIMEHRCSQCGEVLTEEDEDEGVRRYIEEELEGEERAEAYAKLLK